MNTVLSAIHSPRITCGVGITCTLLATLAAAVTAVAFFLFSTALLFTGIGIAATALFAGVAIAAFVQRARSRKVEKSFSELPPGVKQALNQILSKSGYTLDTLPVILERPKAGILPRLPLGKGVEGDDPYIIIKVDLVTAEDISVTDAIVLCPTDHKAYWREFKSHDHPERPKFFNGNFTCVKTDGDAFILDGVEKVGFEKMNALFTNGQVDDLNKRTWKLVK